MKMKLNEIHYNNWREASEQNEKKESKKRLQGQEQQAVNQKEEEKEDNFLLRKKKERSISFDQWSRLIWTKRRWRMDRDRQSWDQNKKQDDDEEEEWNVKTLRLFPR